MKYDSTMHSKNKLGYIDLIHVVPTMPIAAQVSCYSGALHLKLMGDAYVTSPRPPFVPPARVPEVLKALKSATHEPSYSGSSSDYFHLDVEPKGESLCLLKVGSVVVGKVLVDPEAEMFSGDEPLQQQIQNDDESDESDDDEDDDPDA